MSGAEAAAAGERPRRRHTEVMRARLALAGRRVADIGCGTGAMVRFMAREGADVVGVDPSAAMLAVARAEAPAGGERYVHGRGEALPLADAALDVVVYFNALHHVAAGEQPAALAEAARVLVPGGCLYVVEPLAEGAFFELMRPVEDETAVRAAAARALAAAAEGPAFAREAEDVYLAPVTYASFAAFKEQALRIDDSRAAAFARHEAEIARGFPEAAREIGPEGYVFDQPSRLDLLRRR